MGWGSHKLPNDGWRLWTHSGTGGVYIQKEGSEEQIEIPSELLKMLAASDVRSYRISELERAGDNQVLGLPVDHSV